MNIPDLPPALPASYLQASLTPRQIGAMVWAHRRRIVWCALSLAVLAGLLSKFVLPKRYDSEAVLLVDFDVNNPATGREFPSMLAASYLSTQQAIIESPKVLFQVVDELGWVHDAKRSKGYVGTSPDGLREWVADNALSRKLSVKSFKDTRLINISFSDEDPVMAAKVVNTVAKVFIDLQSQAAGGTAKDRAKEYFAQLDELRQKLTDAQTKLAAFRQKTGLLEFEPAGGIDAERLSTLNSRLTELEVASRSAHARASTGVLAQDSEVLGSGLIQNLKARVLELQNNFIQISRELGPRHPDYIAAQKQLEEARAALAREEANYVTSLKGAAKTAGSSEAAVVKEMESQRRHLLEIREQQDAGALLVRDVEAAKKVYDRALEQYDKVVTPSESSFNNVSLVNVGTPAVKPSAPKTMVNCLLGLLGGGALATFAALLWELTHRRIRCVEDLEGAQGVPLLTIIGSTS